MDNKSTIKTVLVLMGGILTVALTMAAVIPFVNELTKVEIPTAAAPMATQVPSPEAPEELLVTAIYQVEEEAKKISAIYIEIFHVGNDRVTYVEIPVDTKVNLSEQLYKSLQTYAPELPQYLKLSNMAESFSEEYGMTGCNRILSEVLDVSIENYIRAEKESLQRWFALQAEEKTASVFFEDYSDWMEQSASNLTVQERWMYYESWKNVTGIQRETAAGKKEKDGFVLSGKQTKERIRGLMKTAETEK